ncbi:MAG: transporter [Bacteroidetes bacterium]|nr:MAG: transporter [Bacteroidota bacterium]
MALFKDINPKLKVNNDTGFGINASDYGGRFINKDGTFNTRKEGISFLEKFSIYYFMMNLPRWKFIGIIVVSFLVVNIIYAAIYMFIGASELTGMIAQTPWDKFKEAFFFSTETFTTVGYGRVNPIGDGANLVASFEAMHGFLSFAIATGLIFGRFSKPGAFLKFSDYALISPYRGKTGLMFRFASYKEKHTLTSVEIRVNVGLQVLENDNVIYKYYDLDLERSKVESLPMNWTVVHPIDDKSPFYGFTHEDMKSADVEIYVLIRGFDDVYSANVQQRTSYTFNEILFGQKFVPMYRESDNGKTTILEMNKLNTALPIS